MLTVQIHRTNGHDEDFECEDWDEVDEVVAEEKRDPDTRRLVVIDETGRIRDEWSR